MMISAQALQVLACITAATRHVQHVIELSAQLATLDDSAHAVLLSEDAHAQLSPLACTASSCRV